MKDDLNKRLRIWQVIALVLIVIVISLSALVAQQQRIMTSQNMAVQELRIALEDRDQKLFSTLSLLRRAAEEISRSNEEAAE